MRAPVSDCCRRLLGGLHAGQHRVVAALDARHVDEACRTPHQCAAREREFGDRLPAAFGESPRAVFDPLAARQRQRDHRVRLESLEFVERRQVRIGVVEVDDEADRHQVGSVIEERAAAGTIVERPSEGMQDKPGRWSSGATSQSSLIPMPNFCGSRPSLSRIARSAPWERAPRSLGDQRILGGNFMPRWNAFGVPSRQPPCRRSQRR